MRLIRTNALRVATCLMLSLLLAPGLALAQAPSSGGMPPLDFKNPLTTSQVVWLVIIFVVLYLLLARWALPQVGEVVEKRASIIAADLETARRAKAEADSAVSELTAATRKAHAEAQAGIAAALGEAKAEAAKQAEEANRRLDAQLDDAEQRIRAARDSAMGALRQVAADTAANVVTRLTGHTPDTASVEAAVGRTIAARG